jgi:hypothetical protein
MSSREVKSLNDLAKAHGGQLTVNPHTGLPEAGILDNLLPTIIGAGVSYFSGGTISPAMIGLGIGGLEAIRSGSVEKGLMAGLGAYGGAGLTEGLVGAGTGAIGMNARDAAIKSATEQGLTGTAYNEAIQNQVAQQMAEKATPFGSLSEGASQLFKEPGKVVDAMGGGWNTAKYAAGAAAPYLASALKPNTPMPDPASLQKPTEYRQYKVTRRPDLSYEYTALPISTTFTPNFAEGGGVSDLVSPYVDPSFKFKNVSGPPRIQTATEMPVHMADGGRITPEEFYQMYMQQGKNPVDLQYGTRGYADTAPATNTTPYERPTPTPADIVGVDGTTYTWDSKAGKYVAKPKANEPTDTKKETGTMSNSFTGAGDATGQKQAQINAFFDNMTPEQQAEHDAQMAAINEGLTPMAVKVLQSIKNAILFKNPNEPLAPEVDMSTMSEAAQAEHDAALQAALQNNAENAPTVSENPAAQMGDTSESALAPASTGEGEGIGMGLGVNASNNGGVAPGEGSGTTSAMGGGFGAGIGGGTGSVGGNAGIGGGATASGIGTGIGSGASSGAGLAHGGLSDAYNLGGYSDGGRLLRGPGDGVSDSIPATIGHKQPARLADGEFVVPARIVSEIGNGSTEAGARKLYAMMDRIQKARAQTVGKGKVAKNTRAEKYLPA